MGVPGSGVTRTPPLHELPLLPSLCHPWLWCNADGYAIFFLALISNGKHQVIKFPLLSKCVYLMFYVTLKDGGTIWGWQWCRNATYCQTQSRGFLFFENQASSLEHQSSLWSVSSDIIAGHVYYQQPADMWAAQMRLSWEWNTAVDTDLCAGKGWRLTSNQCNTNIISWGIFNTSKGNSLWNQLWHCPHSPDLDPAHWSKRPWQFERGTVQHIELCSRL